MVHNHWPVGPEPQLCLTLWFVLKLYSWCQGNGGGYAGHSGEWRYSTPTAMVAVPVLNTALEQRFSILGGTGTGTKMEASIHLRAKDFAAHERWLANLADVIE